MFNLCRYCVSFNVSDLEGPNDEDLPLPRLSSHSVPGQDPACTDRGQGRDIRAIRGNEGMKAFIDNNPAPGDGRSRERRKGTNKMAGGNCHPWCGTGTEVSPTLAAGECWSDSDCGNGEGCNPTQPIPDAPRQPGSCLQDRAHVVDWTYTNAAEPGVIG